MVVLLPRQHAFSGFIDVWVKADDHGGDRMVTDIFEIDTDSGLVRAFARDESGNFIVKRGFCKTVTYEATRVRLRRDAPQDIRADFRNFANNHLSSPIRFEA